MENTIDTGESILERFRRQFEEDRASADYDFPKDVNSDCPISNTEEYKNEYKKRLEEMREDELFQQKQYEAAMRKIHRITENELNEQNLLKSEKVTKVEIKHVFCPFCGKELISKLPPMFNPFTHERQCIHECECRQKFNLDFSYPRLAFYGEDGVEIMAHCE